MKTARWMATVVAALAVFALVPAASAGTQTPFTATIAGASGAPGPIAGAAEATYYVSLGDSLAQGFQPIGGPQSREPFPGYNQGYADQLFRRLRSDYTQLREVKLGCGGESTVTFRTGGRCSYEHGSQLAQAVAFLTENRGNVAFVTVTLGANDVLSGGGVPAIAANLPVILEALKAAAGPGVPIVGMNYYDAFLPVVWAQGGLPALQAEVAAFVGLNNFLELLYVLAGIPVADVESAFSLTDFTLVDGTPLNVLRVCQWTWMCAGPPHGPDIHPNKEGHGAIAQAFVEILT